MHRFLSIETPGVPSDLATEMIQTVIVMANGTVGENAVRYATGTEHELIDVRSDMCIPADLALRKSDLPT